MHAHPVVLTTGGLTGIGRATALAFAQEGSPVVVSGPRDDARPALVTELRALGTIPSLKHRMRVMLAQGHGRAGLALMRG